MMGRRIKREALAPRPRGETTATEPRQPRTTLEQDKATVAASLAHTVAELEAGTVANPFAESATPERIEPLIYPSRVLQDLDNRDAIERWLATLPLGWLWRPQAR